MFTLFKGIRQQIYSDPNLGQPIVSIEDQVQLEVQFAKDLRSMPIAVAQDQANEQHYEVPAAFYQICLGPKLKYSSGYWTSDTCTLEESEVL